MNNQTELQNTVNPKKKNHTHTLKSQRIMLETSPLFKCNNNEHNKQL